MRSPLAKMLALLGLLLLAKLGLGCPPTPPPRIADSRPTPERLAADAMALDRRARQASLPAPQLLVAAYLATFTPAADRGSKSRATAERSGWSDRCNWLRASRWSPSQAAAALAALRMPDRARWRHFLATLLSDPACSSAQSRRRRPGPGVADRPGPRSQPGGSASAILAPMARFWAQSLHARAGGTLHRTEAWTLRRQGQKVTGLVWVDERLASEGTAPRRVSGESPCLTLQALRTLRVHRVAGDLSLSARASDGSSGRREVLRLSSLWTLVPWPARQREAEAPPLRCEGTVAAGALQIRCPDLRTLRPLRPAAQWSARGPASGVYTWHGASPRADGGRERTRETWHLLERSGRISGFYLRETIVRARHGSRFACNGRASFRRLHLFLLAGRRQGSDGRAGAAVSLREVAVLGSPNPCDRSQPSLDNYTGRLRRDALVLSWGSGEQILRRTRQSPLPAFPAICP